MVATGLLFLFFITIRANPNPNLISNIFHRVSTLPDFIFGQQHAQQSFNKYYYILQKPTQLKFHPDPLKPEKVTPYPYKTEQNHLPPKQSRIIPESGRGIYGRLPSFPSNGNYPIELGDTNHPEFAAINDRLPSGTSETEVKFGAIPVSGKGLNDRLPSFPSNDNYPIEHGDTNHPAFASINDHLPSTTSETEVKLGAIGLNDRLPSFSSNGNYPIELDDTNHPAFASINDRLPSTTSETEVKLGAIPVSGKGLNDRLPSFPSNGNYPIELGDTNHPEFAAINDRLPSGTSETEVKFGAIPVSGKGLNDRLLSFPSNDNYPIEHGDTNHPAFASINDHLPSTTSETEVKLGAIGLNDRLPSFSSNGNYPIELDDTNHPAFASINDRLPSTTSETEVKLGAIPVSGKGLNDRLPSFPSNGNYPIELGDTNHPAFASINDRLPSTNFETEVKLGTIPASSKGLNNRLPTFPTNGNYPIELDDTNHPAFASINDRLPSTNSETDVKLGTIPVSSKGLNDRLPSFPSNGNYPIELDDKNHPPFASINDRLPSTTSETEVKLGAIPVSGKGLNDRLPSFPSNGNYPIELGDTNHPAFASINDRLPSTNSETEVKLGTIPVSSKGLNDRLPSFPSNGNYPITLGDTNHPEFVSKQQPINIYSSINPDINDRLPSNIPDASNGNFPETKIEFGVALDSPKPLKSRSKMQFDKDLKQIKTELGSNSTENYPKSNEEFGIVSEASFKYSIDPR